MPDEERKPDEDAQIEERYEAQAARDPERPGRDRGPVYGEPSADTDSDGGLAQNPLTEP